MRASFARLQLTHRLSYIPVGPNKARRRTYQLKVVSINVNGLRGKALQIQELICAHHPDRPIILRQETKLAASVSSSAIFPTDFRVVIVTAVVSA